MSLNLPRKKSRITASTQDPASVYVVQLKNHNFFNRNNG